MSAELEDYKPRKRRLGVDESLIIEGSRKRKQGSEEVDAKAFLHQRPATTPAALNEVREKGLVLYERMTSVRDAEGRQIHAEFLKLPNKTVYPDYYEIIKRPISFLEIKQKIEKSEYTTVFAIVSDFNQCFVNAKRYNAPGSPIFLDAKFLHKLLKDTYDDGAGDLSALDEDANESGGPVRETSTPATSYSAPVQAPALTNPVLASHLPGLSPFPQKRGPTLKPWLVKKLAELVAHKDSTGRQYALTFYTLPDRHAWPEYYNVITHPMCLETVTSKVNKRQYTTLKQFQDDVEVTFANALYFNEETSRVWKDARIMKSFFADLMKEPPPVFVPPRKYNTVRRRAEQEAAAKRSEHGYSEAPESPGVGESGDEDGGSPYATPGGAYGGGTPRPQEDPFALPLPVDADIPVAVYTPDAQPQQLPYAFPTLHLNTNINIPNGAANLDPSPSYPLVAPAASLLASASIFSGALASPSFPSPPIDLLNGNGSLASATPPTTTSTTISSSEPPKPRLISKLPCDTDPPAILRFVVKTTPLTVPITLDNSIARQHSFVVPRATEKVEFVPFFRRPSSFSSKGKSKALDQSPMEVDGEEEGEKVKVNLSARPSGLSFLEGNEGQYELRPKIGLNVVEILVEGEEGKEEVYRAFLTK